MYKLIVNLKCYEDETDKGAIKVANAVKSLKNMAKEKNVEIIICPQFFDLKDCINKGVMTYAQHIDFYEPGKRTGHIIPRNLKMIKVSGTLISHSEHILPIAEIKKRIKAATNAKLVTIVCARNVVAVNKISKLKPDFIAIEPKELIGGLVSISSANPKLIENSVRASNGIPLLVGAGVNSTKDVKTAIKLGANGVLVASVVTRAKDPKKAIKKLLDGF